MEKADFRSNFINLRSGKQTLSAPWRSLATPACRKLRRVLLMTACGSAA